MPGLDDDEDDYDFSLGSKPEPVVPAVDPDDYDFSIEPAAPVDAHVTPKEEPAWYESLLDQGLSFMGGLTKDLGTRAVEKMAPDSELAATLRAQTNELEHKNPLTHLAGDVAGDVALGLAMPGGFAGQGAAGAMSSAASEYGRSGDLGKTGTAAGLGGVVGGTMGALTNRMFGQPARDASLKQILTGGHREAETGLDVALGADHARGTAGSGMDYLQNRARELVPKGYPSPDKLKSAANQSMISARTPPSPPLQTPMNRIDPADMAMYEKDLRRVSRDPRGAGMAERNAYQEQDPLLDRLVGQRRNIEQSTPGVGDALRQYTADSAISNVSTGAPKNIFDAMGNTYPSGHGLMRGAFRYGMQRLPYVPGAEGAMRSASALGANAAGGVGAMMTPGMQAPSQPAAQQLPVSPIVDGEEKAYATGNTMKWALEDVLQGDSGLDEDSLQELTNAVMDGDPTNIYALDHQLRMRFPAYARKIEEALKSVNDDQ